MPKKDEEPKGFWCDCGTLNPFPKEALALDKMEVPLEPNIIKRVDFKCRNCGAPLYAALLDKDEIRRARKAAGQKPPEDTEE